MSMNTARRLLGGLTAVILAGLPGMLAAGPASATTWSLKWDSNNTATGFAAIPVPLGGFSDCNHNAGTATAVCLGLPTALQPVWWAYPSGWPDTANKDGLARQGLYQPQDTVWISGGAMHIKMKCCDANGFNEVAAVLPMKAYGQKFGKFVETWNVSQTGAGFKSAHLLWPVNGSTCCEEDFPEADWDGAAHVKAFSHTSAGANQASFDAGVPFNSTSHTSTIKWTSSSVTFLLDGTVIGTVSTSGGKQIPAGQEKWVIQNESALDGETTTAGETAQMNITRVQVYSCASGC